MPEQLDFFAAPPVYPQGFKFQRGVITRDQERGLLQHIQKLPFKEFEFHGHVGKRRTVSFGAAYDFATERLSPADPIPEFLLELRAVAAQFSGIAVGLLEQALVTEYDVNAGIGWHRDKGIFHEVVGISLLSSCQFRLRKRVGEAWQRVTIEAEPRSAYLLSGVARTEWEHSIPEVDALRYSVTFRSFRPTARQPR